MRLNVKLSPNLERQLIETSMVPVNEAADHVLTIQTTSAIPAPLPQRLPSLPSILAPTTRAASSASQSGERPLMHGRPVISNQTQQSSIDAAGISVSVLLSNLGCLVATGSTAQAWL